MAEERAAVIYTAMFGDYDVVLKPRQIQNGVDFVCFTDAPSKIPDPWEVRSFSSEKLSPKLKSGKVKALAHQYFPNYDRSIWIDANIGIVGNMKSFLRTYLNNAKLAVPEHPYRNCTYEEAEVSRKRDLADADEIKKQVEKYRQEGFPENYGLSETRVLLREHQDSTVKHAMEIWWDEYSHGPERDQLSFEYAMWKSNLIYKQLPSAISVNSRYFRYYPHKSDVIFPELFEKVLRTKWRPEVTASSLAASVVLQGYLSVIRMIGLKNLVVNEGIHGLKKEMLRNLYRYIGH